MKYFIFYAEKMVCVNEVFYFCSFFLLFVCLVRMHACLSEIMISSTILSLSISFVPVCSNFRKFFNLLALVVWCN